MRKSNAIDDRFDITPEESCATCTHLYYDIYSGDFCMRDGFDEFAFSFGDRHDPSVECTKCPQWGKLEHDGTQYIDISDSGLHEDAYFKGYKFVKKGKVYIWIEDKDES